MKFKVGQVWETEGNDRVRIVHIRDKGNTPVVGEIWDSSQWNILYFTEEGKDYYKRRSSGFDLVKLIEDVPMFKVGQIWENRIADEVLIVDVTRDDTLIAGDHCSEDKCGRQFFTKDGKYHQAVIDHEVSNFDLVKLIKDVEEAPTIEGVLKQVSELLFEARELANEKQDPILNDLRNLYSTVKNLEQATLYNITWTTQMRIVGNAQKAGQEAWYLLRDKRPVLNVNGQSIDLNESTTKAKS